MPGNVPVTMSSSQRALSQKTVLVVDDEPDIVEILTSYLQDEGYRVVTAYNGRDGLETARTLHPDLIVLDFMLPMKHGLTFCKDLKADAALSRIPVVILTGTGNIDTVSAALRLGINAYIPKPFERQALLAVIRQIVPSDVSSRSA